MGARKKGNPWLLAIAAVVMLVIVAALLLIRPPRSPGYLAMRAASLLGYQMLFLTIVSSAYLRQMLRWFGRPFLKVHHLAAITGLALVVLHPIAVALTLATARLFLPQLGSLKEFFRYGGSVALYLFILAALIAVFRKALGSRWLALHAVAYVAFLFATVHGFLLGDDFVSPVVKVVAVFMVGAVVYSVVLRRQARRRAPAKPAH